VLRRRSSNRYPPTWPPEGSMADMAAPDQIEGRGGAGRPRGDGQLVTPAKTPAGTVSVRVTYIIAGRLD